MSKRDRIFGALYGAVLGDAAGVPVEFRSRKELDLDPVKSFRAGGTHGQPKFAWSDDSSLMMAQLDSLNKQGRVNYADQARRFLAWYDDAKYTSHGVVFDIGNATAASLERLRYLKDPTRGGSTDERTSGNGALMRILPLCIWLAVKEPDLEKAMVVIEKATSLTHRSILSIRCCQFYSLVVRGILSGGCVGYGCLLARETMVRLGLHSDLFAKTRLWDPEFFNLKRADIKSDGYVVSTLEAALWVTRNGKGLMTDIFTAVNLGGDTDTTACVVGGLVGLSRGGGPVAKHHTQQLGPAFAEMVSKFMNKAAGVKFR